MALNTAGDGRKSSCPGRLGLSRSIATAAPRPAVSLSACAEGLRGAGVGSTTRAKSSSAHTKPVRRIGTAIVPDGPFTSSDDRASSRPNRCPARRQSSRHALYRSRASANPSDSTGPAAAPVTAAAA